MKHTEVQYLIGEGYLFLFFGQGFVFFVPGSLLSLLLCFSSFSCFSAFCFSCFYAFLLLCFSCFSAFLLFCFSAFLLFAFPASLLFCFFACPAFLLLCFSCFSASLLLCFLLFLLLCFSCFSASLLFLLLCFSAICFPCFFAFLFFCFPCFSAFVLLYLSTSTILLFFFQSCVFAALLPAPLLLCFLSLQSLCFSLSFALFSPVSSLNEALEKPT